MGDNGKDGVRKAGLAVLVVGIVALAFWGVSQIKLDKGHAPKRQTVKITLPDTPPPPPPKQEEKKPEPKEDNKPAPQMEQKQIEAPPQVAQTLKMEGTAGDGPSAFSSGSVGKEYSGGAVATGPAGGTGSDRAKYQFYVSSTKQLLKDALERHLQTDEKRVTVTFSLWIAADGRIAKYQIEPTGNERTQADLQTAFEQASQDTKFPVPGDTPQPLRLRMTLLPPAS